MPEAKRDGRASETSEAVQTLSRVNGFLVKVKERLLVAERSVGLNMVRGTMIDSIKLLDRDLPAGYLEGWTDIVAAKRRVVTPGSRSVVIFQIGTECLALPTSVFQEVAEPASVHVIPHRRKPLMGLVNIRGELVICASIGVLLELEQTTSSVLAADKHERLLVINQGAHRVACPVDKVHGLYRYDPADLRDIPAILAKARATFTLGMLPWEGRMVGCLEAELLFYALNKSFA